MANLGKITPTKPIWSRTDEPTTSEEDPSHPQQHPEKEEEKRKESGEATAPDKSPSNSDDKHKIDLFT